MPAWLTWEAVKRVLPYIGIALAAWALWSWAVGVGRTRERDKLQPTIEQLRGDLRVAQGNSARLQAAIDDQNAATKRLAQAEADRLEESSRQLAEAEQKAAGLRSTIDKLKASAAKPGDPCAPSAATLEAWK